MVYYFYIAYIFEVKQMVTKEKITLKISF